MKPVKPQLPSAGYVLLELMMVVAIVAILAAISAPHYLNYLQRSKAAACHLYRRNLAIEVQEHYLTYNVLSELTDQCPAGGVYYWIENDPAADRFPKIGCSIHLATNTGTEPEETGLLFFDEFDAMDALTPLIGKWQTVEGRLVPRGAGERRLAFGSTDWDDYTVAVDAEITRGKGYGVYYRTDANPDITGYIFQYDPGYGSEEFIVRKVVNGREQPPFQRTPIPEDFPIYNRSHTITVQVQGDHHTISVDQTIVLDFHDDTFDRGSPGLRTWSNTKVSFDGVRVSEVGDAQT
jgi:prepilin-type N-terminal cleavage/methylation domain-containing protein